MSERDDTLQHLLESGYDAETAAMTVDEMYGHEGGGPPGYDMQRDPGASAVKALGPMAGALGGGIGARVLAGKLIPKTAQIIGPLISGAGQAAGTFAGGVATGQSPEQAGWNALAAGGLGTTVEGLGNVLTRIGAWSGGVPRATVNETLSSPARAWQLARPFAQPPPEAEFNLAKDMQQRLQTKTPPPGVSSLGKKTVARVRAETAIRRFDRANMAQPTPEGEPPHPLSKEAFHQTRVSGMPDYEQQYQPNIARSEELRRSAIANSVESGKKLPREVFENNPDLLKQQEATIPTVEIQKKILSMIKSDSLEEGQQAVNSYLHDKAASLPDRMSAADLDNFIREHSRPLKKAFGQDQVSLPVEVKKGITGAAIKVRNEALPGAQADFAKAAAQLNSMRAMKNRLLTPKGQVKTSAEGLFKNILKNQATREMFRTYEEQTGNAGVLRAADDLAMKRHWTSEDFGTGGRLWLVAEKFFGVVRGGAKFSAILGQPAGHAAAATKAFLSAMQPTPMEQKIDQLKRPNP